MCSSWTQNHNDTPKGNSWAHYHTLNMCHLSVWDQMQGPSRMVELVECVAFKTEMRKEGAGEKIDWILHLSCQCVVATSL